ncbi:MAG: glycoside hydrolase domain-containing protein [Planctomycetota bacterium]
MRPIAAAFVALLLAGTTVFGQAAPDDKTLFLATFDDSTMADLARGAWDAGSAKGVEIVKDGHFEGALRLPEGSHVSYAAPGNLDPRQGTLSMWIKTDWAGNDKLSHGIFDFRLPKSQNSLTVNKILTNRLGVAMSGEIKGERTWKRSDKDISDWQPGVWHHIAAAWSDKELRFYIDGQPVGPPITDGRAPQGKIEDFTLSGTGIVIDDLRIDGVVRTAEEIKALASAPKRGRLYQFLTKIAPAESKQAVGQVGIDRRVCVDGMTIPLILDGAACGRGVAMRAPASITFPIEGEFAKLVATIGLDDLAGEGASVTFHVRVDGKDVFASDKFGNGTPPKVVEVPVGGAKKIELVVNDCGDGNAEDLADWVNAALVRDAGGHVPAPGGKLADKTVDMYRRRWNAYRFGFDLPTAEKGYLVAGKNYMEDIDPSAPPTSFDASLSAFATPGEYEPVYFVIYAARDLKDVSVEIGDLRCEAGTIPQKNIDVRWVMRGLYRHLYTKPPEQSDVISRFLISRSRGDMEAHTFQEMHITIRVPDDAKAGTYAGALRVTAADAQPTDVPVSLEVLPFKLRPLERKKYGMYYRMSLSAETPGRMELELQDMREHGATILYPGIGVEFEADGEEIKASYDGLRQGLSLLQKFGFNGPIPIHDGFNRVAGLCGATDINVNNKETGESLETNEKFQAAAKRTLDGLQDVQKEFPTFELLPTHMDEVLGRGRLGLYCNLAKPIRKYSNFRIYITLHNQPREGVPEMTQQLLPYVDVRCYNGHAMDEWIKAGHAFEELAQDLKEHNDEAWIYYNIRGSFFTAKWMRIVNGMYMWVGPFKAHCIWIYHSFAGNPLDDTDGPGARGHDFGLAVPDPADGKTPIPTRHFECYREGIDDMRYLCTLEDLIAETRDKAPDKAAAAQQWLDALRASFPKAGDVKDIELESPLLIAFSKRYVGDEYQKIRRAAADHILRLLSVR